MNFDEARAVILRLLQSQGKTKNSEMIAAIGDDRELFALVCEDLIFNDLAEDKKGVGLVYLGPSPSATSRTPAGSPPSRKSTARPRDAVDEPSEPVVGRGRPGTRRLFLSYGRRDAGEFVDRLERDLKARGFEVWRDTRKLRGGEDFLRVIEQELRRTGVVVAVLSPHSVRVANDPASPDQLDSVCLDELSFARFACKKPIVPVMVVQCEPPFSIFRLDYVDLTRWQADETYRLGLARLVEGIEAVLRDEVRYRKWIDRLQPLDFAAHLAGKRRHFSGREWLFREIDAWRISRQERALLIVGEPGVGKSAMVAQLEHLNPGGQVLAYHCCQADWRETLRPAAFVRSMAAMTASRLPAYSAMLEQPAIERALGERMCEEDPAGAFENAILAPLHRLPPPEEGVRYLLIDALDEALALGAGELNLLGLLAPRLELFPAWLRVVATTRAEPGVLRRLGALRGWTLDARDPRNLADLDLYISRRLQSPALASRLAAAGQAAPHVLRQLREKSAGNFLYAQQALDGMTRDRHRIEDLDALPPGLAGLYEAVFQREFPDKKRYAGVKRVLQVAAAAQEPLTEAQLARATRLDDEEVLPRLLRRLAAYLPAREGNYAFYHKSLSEWLTAPEARGSLHYISRKRGHARLAAMLWNEYRADARKLSQYGVRHFLTHLVGAQKWDWLSKTLADGQLFERMLQYGRLLDLMRQWTGALETLIESEEGSRFEDPECIQERLLPLMPHFIRRLEQNIGGAGLLKPECDLLDPWLARLSKEEIIPIFQRGGEVLDRDAEAGRERGLVAMLQVYMECDQHCTAYDLAQPAIRLAPESFMLRHFAAAAAQMGSRRPGVDEADLLQNAIRSEQEAQTLPNAERHNHYGVSLSVLAQCHHHLGLLHRQRGESELSEQHLQQALTTFERRLSYGRTPLGLAVYAECLRDVGKLDKAFACARQACELEWFIREGQEMVLTLMVTDPASPQHVPKLEEHLRRWSLVAGEYPGTSHRARFLRTYLGYAKAENLEPEALCRTTEGQGLDPALEAYCRNGYRGTQSASVIISGRPARLEVETWEFAAPTPRVILGIPAISVFGKGADHQSAARYLAEFLSLLKEKLRKGRWERTGDLQEVAAWLAEH